MDWLSTLLLVSPLALGPEGGALRVGESARAELTAGAARVDDPSLPARVRGQPTDAWTLRLEQDGPVWIQLHSHYFNGYLVLRTAEGEVVEQDDNSFRWHPRIAGELPAGSYRVDVIAWAGALGPYELTVASGVPPELDAIEERRRNHDDAAARALTLEAAYDRGDVGPEVLAEAIQGHAQMLGAIGDLRASRVELDRAIALYDSCVEPGDRRRLRCLQGKAKCLRLEKRYREALELMEEVVSYDDPGRPLDRRAIQFLSSLAELQRDLGNYERARQTLLAVLAHHEESPSPLPREVFKTRLYLGQVLLIEGRLEEADRCLLAALAQRGQEGVDQRDLGFLLEALARLEHARGDVPRAIEYAREAVEILTEDVGEGHHLVSMAFHRLGLVLLDAGDHAEAEGHLRESLALHVEWMGAGHPWTGTSHHALGRLLHGRGHGDEARAHYRRAFEIWTKEWGAEHPWPVAVLVDLARLELDEGRPNEALEIAFSAVRAREVSLAQGLVRLTESERMQRVAESRTALDLLVGTRPEGRAQEARIYEAVLRWKGRVSRELLATRRSLRAGLGAEGATTLDRLLDAQAELSKELFREEVEDRAAHALLLAELRLRRDDLERRVLEAVDAAPAPAPDLARLRAALPPGSAAVDFLVHAAYRPDDAGGGAWDPAVVTAWVVRPESPDPVRVPLGPAGAIEERARAYVGGLAARRGVRVESPVDRTRSAGLALLESLWSPLREHVDGAHLVIVSPDDFLCSVPFGAIPTEGGGFLLEDRAFVYESDLAWVADHRARRPEADGGLLAVGGVDYRNRSSTREEAGAVEAASGTRGFSDSFYPLPGTRREARAIVDLHETAVGGERRLLLLGSEASEERLKAELPRWPWIHVATHGFFEEKGRAFMYERARVGGQRVQRLRPEQGRLIERLPGLLSGLACAGVNGPLERGRDNGLLTAEEVSWLDLSSCEMVVLSACETALGARLTGEGVMGLRRAFQQAGARTTVTSLWKIDDEETNDLMRAFYRRLWLEDTSRAEALRRAQLDCLAQNEIDYGDARPSVWGAFVLGGDWR